MCIVYSTCDRTGPRTPESLSGWRGVQYSVYSMCTVYSMGKHLIHDKWFFFNITVAKRIHFSPRRHLVFPMYNNWVSENLWFNLLVSELVKRDFLCGQKYTGTNLALNCRLTLLYLGTSAEQFLKSKIRLSFWKGQCHEKAFEYMF